MLLLLCHIGGGRVVRRCWVNFQCRGVLLIWITVGQGPTALAVGAGGGCLDIFTLVYHFSFLSPSLWETARYRLKYCLKGPLSPKQPTKLCHISGEQKDKIDCFDVAIHQMQWLFCIFAFGILEYAHVTTNRPAHANSERVCTASV